MLENSFAFRLKELLEHHIEEEESDMFPRAKELLDNSQMPITSIGYEAGFKDPSYFARAFKQSCGCTPSEYRQAHRPGQPMAHEPPIQVLDSLAHATRS